VTFYATFFVASTDGGRTASDGRAIQSKLAPERLNWDCCYCLGIPFTYRPDLDDGDDGIEILKLHGSMNWTQCSNEKCEAFQSAAVAPLQFKPIEDGAQGTVEIELGE
jgi:hypothetical protein